MSALALTLVLTAALCHALWNYVLKKCGGGLGVVTLSAVLGAIMLTPFAIYIFVTTGFRYTWIQFGLVFGSGLIHTVYFLMLDRAYRAGGDLSIVYPLARASGPLITIVAAAILLGERMSFVALCGAVLIGISAFLLTGSPREFAARLADHSAARSIRFALLTGVLIATYTVWDKQSVAVFLIPPIIFDWTANLIRIVALVPLAHVRQPGSLARAWQTQRKAAFLIGFLSPLSYILVLTAMTFTPVSYVAPAREVSILFAALLGTQLLNEGNTTRRMIAAAGMVLGMAALTLG